MVEAEEPTEFRHLGCDFKSSLGLFRPIFFLKSTSPSRRNGKPGKQTKDDTDKQWAREEEDDDGIPLPGVPSIWGAGANSRFDLWQICVLIWHFVGLIFGRISNRGLQT